MQMLENMNIRLSCIPSRGFGKMSAHADWGYSKTPNPSEIKNCFNRANTAKGFILQTDCHPRTCP